MKYRGPWWWRPWKPAREPASSRPKPCASLKKPHESCPFAAPSGPRRKKNDSGQISAFPSETSRFALSILAHSGSALPWLVNDRAALRLRRIWCVPTRKRTTRLSATVLPASRVPPPYRRAPNWSSEEAHLKTPSSANHTAAASQPTGRTAKAASWLHLSSPALHPPERPSHTHTPKAGFGGRRHEK